jgi:hypothetical protein
LTTTKKKKKKKSSLLANYLRTNNFFLWINIIYIWQWISSLEQTIFMLKRGFIYRTCTGYRLACCISSA